MRYILLASGVSIALAGVLALIAISIVQAIFGPVGLAVSFLVGFPIGLIVGFTGTQMGMNKAEFGRWWV